MRAADQLWITALESSETTTVDMLLPAMDMDMTFQLVDMLMPVLPMEDMLMRSLLICIE